MIATSTRTDPCLLGQMAVQGPIFRADPDLYV